MFVFILEKFKCIFYNFLLHANPSSVNYHGTDLHWLTGTTSCDLTNSKFNY
jgi:hypothetical protein